MMIKSSHHAHEYQRQGIQGNFIIDVYGSQDRYRDKLNNPIIDLRKITLQLEITIF